MTGRRCFGMGMVFVLSLFIVFAGVCRAGAAGKGDPACQDGISLEKAASILDVASGDLVARSFKQGVSPNDVKKKTYAVPPCSYSYRAKTDFRKSIHYVVYAFNDPARARATFDRMKGNFATAAKVAEVPGVGETAFRVNDKRFDRFVVLDGKMMIDVLSPKDLKRQKGIVRLLLKK